jgi:transposase
MLEFRLKTTIKQNQSLNNRLKSAQQLGLVQQVKRILALLALSKGNSISQVATLLKVTGETVRLWLQSFLLKGIHSLEKQTSPGRPPKLTKAQKKDLAQIIDKGPEASGYTASCWRSPMLQDLIKEKYGISYSVHYISQLLKNMGFSFQKARFISDHLNEKTRQQWLDFTWPQVLKLAEKKKAYLLFGDEASFPQWGTLSYTWARRGQQPTVKTSGKRKSYKVFGLIDYFTGRFFYQATQARLCSQSYQQFLESVLVSTRKHIFLIQDGARYHTSAALKAFFILHSHRITVVELPSYSPDFNPIEGLWKKIKVNYTHLKHFPSFEALVLTVDEALKDFAFSPLDILPLFGFYTNSAYNSSTSIAV